jgi:MFS family permease
VSLSAYRPVLAVPDVRTALLLGLLLRIPLWAANIILTLHVVSHLGRSYTEAGLLTTVATVALAISGPWRGRLLDRRGLRRTLVPSLAVQAICWSVAPFLPYPALLGLAALAGLYVVPSFPIIRQAMIVAVPEDQRTTVLALDSVAVELSFMIGPALGVLTATWWGTPVALVGCELSGVAAGLALWAVNPRLAHPEDTAPAPAPAPGPSPSRPGRRLDWVDGRVLAVVLATAAATVVLTGSDVSIVAALREMGHQNAIGWVLAIWGAGSAVGGVVYGSLHRRIDARWLLVGLALTTFPAALATSPVPFAALLFAAGLFCAPAITATVDTLSRVVAPEHRGEAMGWHGSALTSGSALGAPLAGVAIDRIGWQAGFVLTALAGLIPAGIAAVAWLLSALRARWSALARRR